MKVFICASLFFVGALTGSAQSAEDSVLVTVNQLFEAMRKADTVLLKNCFSENAVMQTIKENKSGVNVINEKIDEFISFVGKESPGNADERIKVEMVKIDANLATVWTPYQFYYKGKFSHCGVNSFQLVKLNGLWKIQYIIDTRRTTGCL